MDKKKNIHTPVDMKVVDGSKKESGTLMVTPPEAVNDMPPKDVDMSLKAAIRRVTNSRTDVTEKRIYEYLSKVSVVQKRTKADGSTFEFKALGVIPSDECLLNGMAGFTLNGWTYTYPKSLGHVPVALKNPLELPYLPNAIKNALPNVLFYGVNRETNSIVGYVSFFNPEVRICSMAEYNREKLNQLRNGGHMIKVNLTAGKPKVADIEKQLTEEELMKLCIGEDAMIS